MTKHYTNTSNPVDFPKVEQTNRRIKEFAEEVYGSAHCDDFDFAKLIVNEAIAVVQRRFMGDLNREDMEVRRCVEDLKRHFGV